MLPLPGYPWEGRFTTREEIDAYFGGDEIQCLLCGRMRQALHAHLIKVHDMTPDGYREKYGLPWMRGLTSDASRLRRSEMMKSDVRRMEFIKSMSLEASALGAAAGHRPRAEYLDHELAERSRKMAGHDEPFPKAAFLERLAAERTQQEALDDIGWARSVFHALRRDDPDFDRQVFDAVAKQSFRTQARSMALGESFEQAVRHLFEKGWSDHDIAAHLGVTAMAVNMRTKPWRHAAKS